MICICASVFMWAQKSYMAYIGKKSNEWSPSLVTDNLFLTRKTSPRLVTGFTQHFLTMYGSMVYVPTEANYQCQVILIRTIYSRSHTTLWNGEAFMHHSSIDLLIVQTYRSSKVNLLFYDWLQISRKLMSICWGELVVSAVHVWRLVFSTSHLRYHIFTDTVQ